MMTKTIGERIRNARIAERMTLEELAKRIGVTKQLIYSYESGKVNDIPTKRIQEIADALHSNPAVLVGWADESDFMREFAQKKARYSITDAELDLIDAFRNADPIIQNAVKDILHIK